MSDTNGSPVKAGWKTTEFWLSVLAAIVGAVLASGLPSDNPVVRAAGVASAALAALGYSISRGNAKAGPLLILICVLVFAGCTMSTPAETRYENDGKGHVVTTSKGQGVYEAGLGADIGNFATVAVGSSTAKSAGAVKGAGVSEVSSGDNVTHLTTITGQAASIIPALVKPTVAVPATPTGP